MTDQTPKRPRGRPRRYATKRQNVSFRATADLHQRLVAAAQRSGRGLSEEVTWRVEHSLQVEQLLGDAEAYAARVRRTADAQVEARSGFVDPVEAALPFVAPTIMPPALRSELEAAVRDGVAAALEALGFKRTKGVA